MSDSDNATVQISRGDVLWPEGQERPTGLRDDDWVDRQDGDAITNHLSGWSPSGGLRSKNLMWGLWILAVRVPANSILGRVQAYNLAHPKHTFDRVWWGEDAAPGDWGGGEVLLRNGSSMFPSKVSFVYHANGTNRWNQDRPNRNPDWDIIAYNARKEAPGNPTSQGELPENTVTIRGRVMRLDSLGELERLIRGGARIEAINFRKPPLTPADRLSAAFPEITDPDAVIAFVREMSK